VAVTACARAPGGTTLSPEELALENRGVGLMGQYDFDRARDAFASLAASHPDRADLRIQLAIALLNRQQPGDEDEARRMLEAIVASDPKNTRAHYGLGLILFHGGRARDALPHFVAAAAQAPRDAHAAYFLAQCRAELGDLEGARQSYEQALALNPRLRSAAYGAFRMLQRLGRSADADRLLRLFQELEKSPQSEIAEFKYTRMGRLADVSPVDAPPRARSPRPAGAVFERAPLPLAASARPIAWRRFDAASPASITAADIDGDGRIDLFIARAIDDGGVTRNAVLLNRPDGFTVDPDHPLARVTDVTAVLWGDYDNDGLTDVYLCRDSANQLWRQTAPGSWSNVTTAARASGRGRTVDGAMFDADHDGDLDLLLVGADGANELLNNNGDGTFRSLATAIGLSTRSATGLVLADLDADRDADIIVMGASPPHQALVNDRTWQYRSDAAFDRLSSAAIGAAVAADLNADGIPELYASGPTGLERWVRGASGAWEPRHVAGTEAIANTTRLAIADVDGDGRLDVVASGADGRWQALAISDAGDATLVFADADTAVAGWALAILDAVGGPSLVAMPAATAGPPILWRPGPGRFPFVTVAPSGRNPSGGRVRSNQSGIGTAIAARADSRWTTMANLRSESGAGQSLQPVAIGTGGEPQLDFIALTWSDGVLQTELALKPGSLHAIAERSVSSRAVPCSSRSTAAASHS
jgi:Tfp pilus assembly protein PilF